MGHCVIDINITPLVGAMINYLTLPGCVCPGATVR